MCSRRANSSWGCVSIEGYKVVAEPGVVAWTVAPATLARDAVHFFFATFMLSRDAHRMMVDEVGAFAEGCTFSRGFVTASWAFLRKESGSFTHSLYGGTPNWQ